MRRAATTAKALGSVLAMLAAVTACAPGDVTEAGFPNPPATLTIGVPADPGTYSHQVTEEFARRVTERSQGALMVQVENVDTRRPRWNQENIARVQSGSLDLLVVSGQAWDTFDVDTLTALYVPFLIADEEHLDAVLTSDLVDPMLAGLDGTGVTGLGIVPEGMSHVLSGDEASTLPSDVVGDGIRASYSTTIWRMLADLGARPDDPNGWDVEEALRDRRIRHLMGSLAGADASIDAPKTAGDVALYPYASTIVANDAALARISPSLRELLTAAARDVARWAADTRTSDADAARALCARSPGAEVVLAGDEAIAHWRQATAELATQLRADPVVGPMATRIEQLRPDRPAEPPRPCVGAPEADPVASPTVPNVPVEFPEGSYRKEVSLQSLLERGVEAATAHNHVGVWTLVLRNGVLGGPDHDACPGSTYEIVEDRVVVTLGPEGPECGTAAGRVLFSAGWLLDGSQLTFTDVRSGHGGQVLISSLFGGEPWTKID